MAERAEIILSAADRTAAAFASAQRNLTAFSASATRVVSSIGGIAAGVGAAGLALTALNRAFNPTSVIQYADQLGKLSQRTGLSTESLSALDYQAKLADVSTEELATSLKKLNLNIAAAARGEKEQAEAFKLIGVSVKDAAGQTRNAEAVLGDIAEKFATYADGPEKLAIANAVGGKSFEKLIPLLNEGRKGVEEARKELEKFGGVIGPELSAKSQQFNDNLTRLGVAANALKVAVAGGLIDDLVKLSDRMVQAARDGNLLEFSLKTLNRVLDPAGVAFNGAGILNEALPPDRLKEAQVELDRTTAQVVKLKAQLAGAPGNQVIARQLALVEETAKSAGEEVARLRAAAGSGALSLGDLRAAEKDRSPVKVAAPRLPGSGADADASALLRKQLDGRIKAIQEALAEEADVFAFQNTRLADQFADGELSINAFYDAKRAAQEKFLVDQDAQFEKEINALRDFQRRAAKPAERQEAENKIDEVLDKQAKAYREAGQAAEQAERQRARASEDFRRSLLDLDAQIAEIAGDKFGAELLRNAERLDAAAKLLARGGVSDPARLAALQAALAAQAEFGRLQDDIARANAKSATEEEAFLIRAQRLGLSRADTEAELLAIRNRGITQLDQLIAATERLAAASQDPSVLQYLEQLRVARERAFDARDPGLQRFNELAAQGGRTLADGLASAVLEGERLSDVLTGLDKKLTALIFEDLVTQPLAENLTNFIKGLGAGGTGGGAETLITGILGQLGLSSNPGAGGGTGDFARGDRAAGAAVEIAGGAIDAAGQAAQSAAASAATAALTALSTAAAAAATADTTLASTSAARAAAEAGNTTATIAATAALNAYTAALSAAAAQQGSEAGVGLFAGVFHGGGKVGAGGATRLVPAAAFVGAPMFHGGGTVGEVPAILRKGETVLTEAESRQAAGQRGAAGARPIHLVVQVQAQQGMTRQTALQQGRAVGEAAQLALARNG